MKLPKFQKTWQEIKTAKPKEEKPEEEKEKEKTYFYGIIIPWIKIILIYGGLLNYTAFILLNARFTFYSWPAYGLAYYFITEEATAFFRNLIPRKN